MAAALAGHFPVLTAGTPETALGLIARHGPCGAAFCAIADDPQPGLDLAARLVRASPGIAVTALFRPPWPDALLRAVDDGVLDGICPLPFSPETLRETARRALAATPRGTARIESPVALLTREEVDFLLGRDLPEKRQVTVRNH
jgi:DNA-binding NarL/FixJ family response regulator